ncbi:MAG TPA: PQQ-dependent sugar dehydrogenase, partial [Burkholderiales bacterium]|nr:PQQ-dependent sugar dehydrogenase [Burkholderiales bacterium]
MQVRHHEFSFAAAFLLVALALAAPGSIAKERSFTSEKHGFRLVTLIEGLENPWSIAFLPDGRMLVTERPGRLRIVSKDFRLEPGPVEGLPPIVEEGQGGLFDVVLHPRYAENGWIYLSYNGPGSGGWATELLRARLEGNRLADTQVLFRLQPKSRTGLHFGGRIVFDRKGFLYLTLGERGDKERAQRLDDHAGSVIRLHDDGRVPADNPFMDRPPARPEKFTLGNRNM